ncbi:type II secretion system F family protein [Tardiphaga robiniae]|uniref:Type II secretion system F family protein n=1 Tax=Tardiphaga robiniae TaxID=943830 RepID=A0A7G6TUM4_9BRAD|nr:type II secretion system F family protein [Tardiphaga robiniae]QND70456.1 type II secretion system F family protein [Tardiphaga robiniae]
MAQFVYRAYTAQGAVTTGTIVAEQRDAAIKALYGNGLTPFETQETTLVRSVAVARPSPAHLTVSSREPSETPLSLRALSQFTVELSSLVGSGMPLDEVFRVISSSDPRGRIGRMAAVLLTDVLAGAQLSEAMAVQSKTFAADYRAIVAAGEAAGALAPALAEIAALLVRRLELRSKIATALVYPLVILAMSVVSVGVIIAVLIPSLAPVFTDAGMPLPGILATFAGFEDHLPVLIAGACMIVCLIMAGLRVLARNASARRACDRMLCAIPLVGRMIMLREAAAFSRALGTLVGARAPLMAALHTATDLVGNAHLAARYKAATALVPQGTSISRAFAGTGLIPPSGLSLVAVGEETGQLGSMLSQVAAGLEADLQRRIERLVGLLTPVFTLAIGMGVGGLILQVMTAVLSINDLAFQ